MKLIFCLDDKNGMMFNGRRQSQDKLLRVRVLSLTGNNKLVMSPYSAKQFTEDGITKISDDPQHIAESGDFYFVEDRPFSIEDADEIIIYRWNRHYPADVKFNHNIKDLGFALYYTYEFEGSSHEKITEERYKKGDILC
jgi:hypothetical protein